MDDGCSPGGEEAGEANGEGRPIQHLGGERLGFRERHERARARARAHAVRSGACEGDMPLSF